MPKIRWKDLPPTLREHLIERLRERKVSASEPATRSPEFDPDSAQA